MSTATLLLLSYTTSIFQIYKCHRSNFQVLFPLCSVYTEILKIAQVKAMTAANMPTMVTQEVLIGLLLPSSTAVLLALPLVLDATTPSPMVTISFNLSASALIQGTHHIY